MKIYTSEGWQEVDDLDEVICCDCDQPATRITDASRYHDGSILWAQCSDCAHETRAESIASAMM